MTQLEIAKKAAEKHIFFDAWAIRGKYFGLHTRVYFTKREALEHIPFRWQARRLYKIVKVRVDIRELD